MEGQILALSFQSVAELWSWAEENNWGSKQRNGLTIFLRRFLVIPYDPELAKVWAQLGAHCKRIGAVWKPVTFGLPLPLFVFAYRCSRMIAITLA